MRVLTTFLTAPVGGTPGTPEQKADALTNAQVLLIGLTMAIIVLFVAIGILVGFRIRRRAADRRAPKPVREKSAWELAGERADADEDAMDFRGGGDPNDDTWAGSAP